MPQVNLLSDSPRRRAETRAGWSRLLLAIVVASSGGCLHRQLAPQVDPPLPVVFQQPPSLSGLIEAVNANSDRVYDLQTNSGHLQAAGLPRVRATLRVERPQRMRLQGTLVTSPVLDLGSNDELFWLWFSGEPVRYARHSQFATSVARQVIPVEPSWVIETLGLVHLDPGAPHRGPYQRPDGTLELHTPIPTAAGEVVRVLAIHPQHGVITEVQVRDAQGVLLASARSSRHVRDQASGVILPRKVELALIGSQLPISQVTFEADHYTVNQLRAMGVNPALWNPPPGASEDLGDPRLLMPTAQRTGNTASAQQPGAALDQPYRPEFRGYSR